LIDANDDFEDTDPKPYKEQIREPGSAKGRIALWLFEAFNDRDLVPVEMLGCEPATYREAYQLIVDIYNSTGRSFKEIVGTILLGAVVTKRDGWKEMISLSDI